MSRRATFREASRTRDPGVMRHPAVSWVAIVMSAISLVAGMLVANSARNETGKLQREFDEIVSAAKGLENRQGKIEKAYIRALQNQEDFMEREVQRLKDVAELQSLSADSIEDRLKMRDQWQTWSKDASEKIDTNQRDITTTLEIVQRVVDALD